MAKHALLSPSSAFRWLYCARAPHLEAQFPDVESQSAAEGTLAHAIAETVTRYWIGEQTETQYEDALAKLKTDKLFSPEMIEHATDYAKFIIGKAKELTDPVIALEQRLDISSYVPKCTGTGDCIIVSDGILEIIDYKYGVNYRVEAEGNQQMRLYALGALKAFSALYDVDTVRMTIYQPRIANGISHDEMPRKELEDWGKNFVKPRAKLAYADEGDFYPSEHTCLFCKAREVCRARTENNLALFDENQSDTMTLDEIGAVLERSGDIRRWLTDLENKVFTSLADGVPVRGWKLVAGRSNRKYTDEAQVAETLKSSGFEENEIFERKLLTITALEKNLGKKTVAEILEGLIEKPEGKPTLAPESDKRPAISMTEQIIKRFDEE